MGDRRMISKRISNSTRFLKMAPPSRLLYYDLIIAADDDGIVEAFPIIRMTGASEESLIQLEDMGFIKILNDDFVTYIIDWTEHNRIRADRKIDSIHINLLKDTLPEVEILQSKERADVSSKKSEASDKRTEQHMDSTWTSTGQSMDGVSKDKLSKDNNNTPSACVFSEEEQEEKTQPAREAPDISDLPAYLKHWKKVSKRRGSIKYPEEFTSWCSSYPRIENKKRTFQLWLSAIEAGASCSDLLTAASNYQKAKTGTEKTYLQHSATFLGPSEPWRDYLESGPELCLTATMPTFDVGELGGYND